MLGIDLTVAATARRRRANGAPPPVFPPDAYGYWEGQGQSNMTGFNAVGDAPAALRIVNPDIEMMTSAPGWTPYALLDAGESQTVDGTLYEGKLDEVEIPAAAGGAGPLIGLHEAMVDGDMSADGALLPAGLLMGKFSDAGKLLDEFLPGYDDGSAPLGGANFNARNNVLPGLLRGRLAAGDAINIQGKIWMHGEANAAAARALADANAPVVAGYAAGLASLRDFERDQFGAPALPWYLCAIHEADVYDAAINAQLESLCRWRVDATGAVADLGAGRDATSYFIAHGIDTGGNVHFNMTQTRAIGALVWAAHQHLAGASHGLTTAYPLTAIRPAHQRPPAVTDFTAHEISVDAVVNEDGALYGLIQPAGAPAPDAATIIATGQASAAALRGRATELSFLGLTADTAHDIWLAFDNASGDVAAVKSVTATTDVAPPPPTGWTPADADTRFWWDAQEAGTVAESGGAVTGWTGRTAAAAVLAPSGAGAEPVFAPAGLNGLPAVDFGGDADLEGAASGFAADMCLLVVAEVDIVTNGSEALIDFEAQNLKVRANNSSQFRARFELLNGGNVNVNPNPAIDYKGAPHLFLARYDSAAQTVEVWIDGENVGTGSGYAVALTGADNIRLMRPWGSGLRLDGRIGEVVGIASSAVADRENLEGYAAHRWGLAGALPAGHPYKSAAP